MRLPPFEYLTPNSLDKALRIKAELGSASPVVAGGTDLVVHLKYRLSSPSALISLKNVREMRGIEKRFDSVVIRAGTTLADVAVNDAIRAHFPLLRKAVQSIGAVGIQHYRGTIGGNLCLLPRCILYNQSYFWRSGKGTCHRTGGKDCLANPGGASCQAICSGDTVPVLGALSAQLTIAGAGGTRTIPIGELFTGKGESPFTLRPEEILTEIRLPLPWAPISGGYHRFSARSSVDFPVVNAAAAAVVDKGKVEMFRLVISGAGPAPIVFKEAETWIKGQIPDEESIELTGEMARKAVEGVMIENASMGKQYRIKMASVMAKRATREALGM